MNNTEGRLAIPVGVRSHYEAALAAHELWLQSKDDPFSDMSDRDVLEVLRARLADVVSGALKSGVDPHELERHLARRFPEAERHIRRMIPGTRQVELTEPNPYAEIAAGMNEEVGLTKTCSECGLSISLLDGYCSKCGAQIGEPTISELLAELHSMQLQVNALHRSETKTELPRTALLSSSFMARAFAVYGHALVAGLILGLPVYLLVLLLGLAS